MMSWWPFIAPLTVLWGESMVRACWQGGVVIVLVFGVCRCLPRLSPPVRCWLWRLAYLKLLLSLIGLAPISLPLLPETETVHITVLGDTQIALSRPEPSELNRSRPQPITAPPPIENSSPRHSFDWVRLLAWAWLAGMVFTGIRMVHAWHRSRCLRQSGTPVDDEVLISICHRLCSQLGIARPPRLIVRRR